MNYALITGASKGIGKAIAEELASRNINVLLVARSEDLLLQVAQNIQLKYKVTSHYLAIDLASENASKQVYDWCVANNYTVNIVINNAGYGLSGKLNTYPLQDYKTMMQLNMNTVVEMSYCFLEMLQKQNQSYIVNIASTAAYQSVPGLNIYSASKSFVLSFSRGLAYELKNTSIAVTCICPGATDTNFAAVANVTSEKALKMAKQFNMNPTQVAKIIVEGMLNRKKEIVPGLVNKINKLGSWLLPKNIVEKMGASIYHL
jgi:uncharacterized protein